MASNDTRGCATRVSGTARSTGKLLMTSTAPAGASLHSSMQHAHDGAPWPWWWSSPAAQYLLGSSAHGTARPGCRHQAGAGLQHRLRYKQQQRRCPLAWHYTCQTCKQCSKWLPGCTHSPAGMRPLHNWVRHRPLPLPLLWPLQSPAAHCPPTLATAWPSWPVVPCIWPPAPATSCSSSTPCCPAPLPAPSAG